MLLRLDRYAGRDASYNSLTLTFPLMNSGLQFQHPTFSALKTLKRQWRPAAGKCLLVSAFVASGADILRVCIHPGVTGNHKRYNHGSHGE